MGLEKCKLNGSNERIGMNGFSESNHYHHLDEEKKPTAKARLELKNRDRLHKSHWKKKH